MFNISGSVQSSIVMAHWPIRKNQKKLFEDQKNDTDFTFPPMSRFPRFLFLIASVFAAFLQAFQLESRILYFPNQEGSYLTKDEHWINQTLDHFSPTVISFFLCLLNMYLISFSLPIVFNTCRQVEKYSICDNELWCQKCVLEIWMNWVQ